MDLGHLSTLWPNQAKGKYEKWKTSNIIDFHQIALSLAVITIILSI